MNRKKFILLTALMLVPMRFSFARLSAVRTGGGDGSDSGLRGVGGGGGGGRMGNGEYRSIGAARPSVVIKMQHRAIPRPQTIRNADHVVRDRRSIDWPRQDEHGAQIQQRASAIAPSQHLSVVSNPAVVRGIRQQQRLEAIPNHYYWHTQNGIHYAHYFDHGIHWYGFYHGPTFYWCRYYADRWWWFDVGFNRWVYWWDGYWWWPSPSGAAYVYVDNNYYPYEGGGVTVQKPELEAPPQTAPTPTDGHSWKSPDGRRMVQVYGDQSEAFLYDSTVARPAFLKYLAQDVSNVRFSGGSNGKPVQILVDFKDGNFALFTENGDPLDAANVAPPPFTDAPPPAPPSTP